MFITLRLRKPGYRPCPRCPDQKIAVARPQPRPLSRFARTSLGEGCPTAGTTKAYRRTAVAWTPTLTTTKGWLQDGFGCDIIVSSLFPGDSTDKRVGHRNAQPNSPD